MKKTGILNPQLAELVASMGHGDILMIGDRGIPFPQHEETVCIDLSIKQGMPTVKDVMEVVLSELEIESVIMAKETKEKNPKNYKEFMDVLSGVKNCGNAIVVEEIPHYDAKNLWLNGAPMDPDVIDTWGREIKGVVRTGDFAPFSYIMLVAGVDFG
ncbi:MAG TPA: D-ribose pyranase [Clostridiales bacterium]|nr:D-ribose pyranase [Clostridiales bacterium]